MTTDIIEGEAIEVERALVVAQPGQALVAQPDHNPHDMIAVATALAGALKDVVERQKLFTVISGKKFPQVEAWMTIGRMDNVVAREAERPIRNDDGSYEAFVELVRLSDGMVIGRASALCGTQDDRPWNNRSEPARRSMAVTRATSRAFRQQYSWIMALAGYEPTPADEMPDERGETHQPAPRSVREAAAKPYEPPRTHDGGLIGTAKVGNGKSDFELRETPEGMAISFRLAQGRQGIKIVAFDGLAEALYAVKADILEQRVTCWGTIADESFDKDGRTITYQVMTLARIQTPEFTLPAPTEALPDTPLFSEGDMAALDAELVS